MIPGWKVKRELLRLRQQFAWYWQMLHAPRRTRQHDRDRPKLVKRSDGTQPAGAKVAALLIFQPGEMPGSILEECDLLTGLGYSVLVVSNGPLQDRARAALLPHVWRLLERPNLGYDFGGYREAVMHLWDEGTDPDELLILNDSVWVIAGAFPAFLARLAGLEADVTGSVLRSKKGKRWLESYFFRFNRVALTSSAFRRFWRDYRLVNSKFGVIRHGERDFTVALGAGGLRIAALGDNAGFLSQMALAPDDEVRLALSYANTGDDDVAGKRARHLARTAGPEWRPEADAQLAKPLADGGVWPSQYPVAGLRVMGYPFIKKSREPVNFSWREQVLRAAEAGVFPGLSRRVLDEMMTRQSHGISHVPHWITPSARPTAT